MMENRSNGMECERVRLQMRTALGNFVVLASARGLCAVSPLAGGEADASSLPNDGRLAERARVAAGSPPLDGSAWEHAHEAAATLRRYAEGEPARYEGPLDVPAPAFHVAVWEHLRSIPFGTTRTYGEVAAALGVSGEARLVGSAVAANPVCILVPCHRVVGADGTLRGFAWGLDLKRRLLAHEGWAALPLFATAEEPCG